VLPLHQVVIVVISLYWNLSFFLDYSVTLKYVHTSQMMLILKWELISIDLSTISYIVILSIDLLRVKIASLPDLDVQSGWLVTWLFGSHTIIPV